MLSDSRFTFKFKLDTINRTNIFDNDKDKGVKKNLERLIEIRNILAHSYAEMRYSVWISKKSQYWDSKTDILTKKEKDRDLTVLREEFQKIYDNVKPIVDGIAKEMSLLVIDNWEKRWEPNAKKKTTKK